MALHSILACLWHGVGGGSEGLEPTSPVPFLLPCRILSSCTGLMQAIQALVLASKDLQREIVESGRVSVTLAWPGGLICLPHSSFRLYCNNGQLPHSNLDTSSWTSFAVCATEMRGVGKAAPTGLKGGVLASAWLSLLLFGAGQC